jgi:exodeoxyribonuclease VII large subunit
MEKPAGEPVRTVSQVNREARLLLERGFPALWVTGEISNLARPASGHVYFSLKDEQAQLRCAMFRSALRAVRFRPDNGQQVLIRGRISLFEARGEFQLIVDHMEPAGDGLLLRRLEELKTRLAREGLFEAARKKALPVLPQRIGIITSMTGAALRDILHILRRRFAAVSVVIYPVLVQGEQAKLEIAAALGVAAARAECDVLILARGGGSLEDLWAFNEEIVARAIFACPLPVVSGVGHEIDFTIADLVADVRAPTPSGAAELVVPDARDWRRRIRILERGAASAARRALERTSLRADSLVRRLRRTHPGFVLAQHSQRLDELTTRLAGAARRAVSLRRLEARHALSRLRAAGPLALLRQRDDHLGRQRLRIASAVRQRVADAAKRFAVATASLQAFSPLHTLERGFALVTDTRSGKLLRSARDLKVGQAVSGQLSDGGFDAVVSKVRPA